MAIGTAGMAALAASALALLAGCKKSSWDGTVVDCHHYTISDAPFGGTGAGTMRSSADCAKDGADVANMFIDGKTIEMKTVCAKGCLASIELRVVQK